jgi:16S rRNA (guanine527-N7)-methyltransferase
MVRKHLLDSLTVQPWIDGPFVTDVGTGAGFPGLPLAIVNPRLRFTLVDSIQKKIRFVQHAAGALGLDNVQAVAVRAESFHPEQRATTVVSRALAALPTFVAQAGHLCAKHGRLLAMKGRLPADEIAALPKGWTHRVERLRVPGLADERTLVIVERTPERTHGR